ncbi:MAG: PQQ-binding-like beta-propeller repeat protein [Phycisphaerae bacterium]|jgi:outer membrane protein assembly factor BamB|nr:PQQ-binding-like beta-propeller repeat protein [Phycisphaerae bacterium]
MLNRFQTYVSYIICLTVLTAAAESVRGGDWPQQRYDNAKTAVVPDAPPSGLKLMWIRQMGKPRSAWPASQDRLQFDTSYHPIIAGELMFVGSMVTDSVTAFDTETGAEKWRFYASGPVRFAPMVDKGKLYFTSDDGYLYCLGAADGKLVWKFRGGPGDRSVLGNDRLTSMWPARTSAMVCEGKVYFGAGIWPFMGTFLHCLDAETGKVIWTRSGTEWKNLPHGGATSFSSIAPQGYIAVSEDWLYVPCGRAVPAVFERETGELVYFHQSSGKKGGGCYVTVFGNHFWVPGFIAVKKDKNGKKDGKGLLGAPRDGVFAEEAVYRASEKGLEVLETKPEKITRYIIKNGRKERITEYILQPQHIVELKPAVTKVFFKAGDFLYGAAGDKTVVAIDVSKKNKPKITWTGKIDGEVWTMITGDDKVIAVTLDGAVYCYGRGGGKPVRHELESAGKTKKNAKWASAVKKAIDAAGTDEGYCVQLGISDGGVTDELVRQSKFHVMVVDSDAGKVDVLRRRMGVGGLYGRRVSAFVGDPAKFPFPQYLANLIISPSADMADACKEGGRPAATLRPYGGVICIARGGDEMDVVLKRSGALPGSGSWTHQYGDPARSVLSKDRLVKLPLGLLWFGGPSNDAILPRHGHGPSPQVVGGRLFIEGRDIIRAVDVYTGRLLWQREIKDIGLFYDNTLHHPGAGQIGANYVSLADGVYVMTPESCQVLDPASGETIRTLTLPDQDGSKAKWGWMTVSDDLLIATTIPLNVQPPLLKRGQKYPKVVPGKAFEDILGVEVNANYASSSKRLVVMDRKTGKVLWSRDAESNFRHNAIVPAAGKVFCIDAMSRGKLGWIKRRGLTLKRPAVLYALDARTGDVVWKTDKDVFGTWLSYSAERDVLIQCGSSYRDRAFDEVRNGITVYRAKTGQVVWSDLKIAYGGPLIIHHDRLITNGSRGYDIELMTGKKTGWKWTRMYGCNTAIASENLLTFRSGAAGYYDLTKQSGTGNFGGFKSSCTANLIVADGVISAPDYTRTCTCSYQNQSSLALVHMPEVETWTYAGVVKPDNNVGLNFGAPGDHLADDGVLWQDIGAKGIRKPKGKKPSPPVKPKPAVNPDEAEESIEPFVYVDIDGEKEECFNNHSSAFAKSPYAWVGASGLVGASSISIETHITPVAVRLYFAEPETGAKTGQRVFTVSLNDEEVLKDFDIVAAAGGARKVIAREFKYSKTDGPVEIKLKASSGRTLLCGVELVAEKK